MSFRDVEAEIRASRYEVGVSSYRMVMYGVAAGIGLKIANDILQAPLPNIDFNSWGPYIAKAVLGFGGAVYGSYETAKNFSLRSRALPVLKASLQARYDYLLKNPHIEPRLR